MKIKIKILATFCIAGALVVSLAGSVVSWLIAKSVHEQSDQRVEQLEQESYQELLGHLSLARSRLDDIEENVLGQTTSLRSDPGLITSVEGSKESALREILASAFADGWISFAWIFDVDGAVLATFPRNLDKGVISRYHGQEQLDQLVKDFIHNNKTATNVMTEMSSHDEGFLRALAPVSTISTGSRALTIDAKAVVLDGFGDPIGVVVTGKLLNGYSKPLDGLYEILGTSTAIQLGGQLIASAGFGNGVGNVSDTGNITVSEDLVERISASEEPINDVLTIGNTDYLSSSVTIRRLVGQPLAILTAAIPATRITEKGQTVRVEGLAVQRRIQTWMLGIGAIALLGLAALSMVISGSITKSLNLAVVAMRDIAEGDGDLKQRLPVTGRDEVSQLVASFNDFVAKIQSLIVQVGDSSNIVSDATTMMSEEAQRNSEGVNQQRLEVEHVATAINQTAQATRQMAMSAASAAEAAKKANQEVLVGGKTVDQTIDAINQLEMEVERTAEKINRLSANSEDIGAVIEVINGIADQTNLLALNAAIEAARAGESGRGFAVVADEVRSLAGRTQEATKQIRQMIERMQMGAMEAVRGVEESRVKARTTVDQASQAGGSLRSIGRSVCGIMEQNTEIAGTAREQGIVVDEINSTVIKIADFANATAASTEQVAKKSNELTQLSGKLKTLVNQFKI
ncbi:MAG: HAMP domain-containing protein [Gammaproteobacteria bacterium]|nr:HAMP domain-containing protein [Gammaproteobacteria bacterium]